jgi:hypothetical protein
MAFINRQPNGCVSSHKNGPGEPPEPKWKGFDDFKDHIHPRQPTFEG